MSLLDDLASATNRRHGLPCSVAVLYKSMPAGAERSAVRIAIDAKIIHGTTLAAVLVKNGHPIKSDAIQRHRRGDCGCPTS